MGQQSASRSRSTFSNVICDKKRLPFHITNVFTPFGDGCPHVTPDVIHSGAQITLEMLQNLPVEYFMECIEIDIMQLLDKFL